ncbi:MAG: hypothetical protein K9H16_06830 [Bacteroidales bacterium]|nr:hypothetical protein [Bacteroidales bacterium]
MKTDYSIKSGLVSWQSPSNIALIKYWGKKGFQIPANASLSITLSESVTRTKIEYRPGTGKMLFYFEDKKNQAFAGKIAKYMEIIADELPYVKYLDFEIQSRNTFPHSAGIASSASAMSALALCLCSIENDISKNNLEENKNFYQRASHFARIGSGSASRSVYGKLSSWGKSEFIPDSSDLFASPVQFTVHPFFENFQDTILIVSKGEKKVSSSAGHGLMKENPFARSRYSQASANLAKLIHALKTGNSEDFIAIVENEALTLHGMMMASNPGYILMKPNTVAIIKKIQDFREQSGVNLCFTLDAGPNVHVLYPETERAGAGAFIEQELKPLCEAGQIIYDKMGNGPQRIN